MDAATSLATSAHPTVGVDQLRRTLSPRVLSRDPGYVRALTEVFDQLPPIVVHRQTMLVIDGVHRLLAAKKLGRREVSVTYFDGSENEAYLAAVRLNTTHGKPLTLHERKRAVEQILRLCPEWSDRRVADHCAVSSKTVSSVRARSTAVSPQSNDRVGRDGRTRPLDPAGRRRRVAELIKEIPEATIRQLAAEAGTSPATVLDVRRRLAKGASPVPAGLDERQPQGATTTTTPVEPLTEAAFQATPACAKFAQWFAAHAVDWEDGMSLCAVVPLGRVYEISDEARFRARFWNGFARSIEERTQPRCAD